MYYEGKFLKSYCIALNQSIFVKSKMTWMQLPGYVPFIWSQRSYCSMKWITLWSKFTSQVINLRGKWKKKRCSYSDFEENLDHFEKNTKTLLMFMSFHSTAIAIFKLLNSGVFIVILNCTNRKGYCSVRIIPYNSHTPCNDYRAEAVINVN